MRRLVLFTVTIMMSCALHAQVSDDFSDGNFTANPTWNTSSLSGSSDWIINDDNQLQTSGPTTLGNAEIYIATTHAPAFNANTAEWLIKTRYLTNDDGSGSNYTIIYLMSDKAELSDNPSGYYIRLGEGGSADGIDLFKTSSSSAIISDESNLISDGIDVSLKVTRTPEGRWTLEADPSGGSNFRTIGTTTDTDFTSSSHFGLLVGHSSARPDQFVFDDINVTLSPVQDTTPPKVVRLSATSETEVVIGFDENVEEQTSQNPAHYSIPGLIITNAARDLTDKSLIKLTTSPMSNGTTYTLTIKHVEDESGNLISSNTSAEFQYFVLADPAYRDIVINEFIVDPDAATSIPNAEFIELYNPTGHYYDLSGFRILEKTSSTTNTSGEMERFVLAPNSFVIITATNDASLFTPFGSVIAVNSFPNLNLTNTSVVLEDAKGSILDEVGYGTNTPRDGISFEQINPELACTGDANFLPSTDLSGGTPGSQNSVFDNTPDTTPPVFSSIRIISADSIQVTFSEPIEPSTLNTSDFSIPGFGIQKAGPVSNDVVGLKLTSQLDSETTYKLAFSSISDCAGNEVKESTTSFYYDATAPTLQQVIVVDRSSIFLIFNEPINESIAERESNFLMDQGIGRPTANVLQDTARNRLLLPFQSSFAEGTSYTLNYANIEDTSTNALASRQVVFTYEDNLKSVEAISSNLVEVQFSKVPGPGALNRYHYTLDDGQKPLAIGQVDRQGKVYRLSFKKALDDNTNLTLYIEGLLNQIDNSPLITPAQTFRYDTNNPSLISVIATSANELRLQFDEALSPASATTLSFYELEGMAHPTQATVSDNGVLLRFLNDFAIEQELSLTYSRIADVSGNFSTSRRTARFTYDPLAPRVDSVFQLSPNKIRVFASEPVESVSLFPGNFKMGNVSASYINLQGPDSIEITLHFNSIVESTAQELTISQWQDKVGNKLSSPISSILDTQNPRFSAYEIQNDSTLRISYSQSMDEKAFDPANYSFEGLSIETVFKTDNRTATITFYESLEGDSTYTVSTSNLTDLDGQALQFSGGSFTFNTFLQGYTFIDAKTLQLDFSTDFSEVGFKKFLLANSQPVLVSIDSEDASLIQLVFDSQVPRDTPLPLYWTDLFDRYGGKIPDHTESVIYDITAPNITLVRSGFNGQLEIAFNENLLQASTTSINQYNIVGLGPALSVRTIKANTISAEFEGLVSGSTYELTVQSVQDLSGNSLSSDTLAFTYDPPAVVPVKAIVISEVMADPTPAQGLPQVEYLELFNKSDVALNLRSLTIAKSSSNTILPDFLLEPNAYVTLVDNTDLSLFSDVPALGLEGLISLNNGSDSIVLVNVNGELVDQVEYDLDWYRDTDKDDGGFSLEIINPYSECNGAANWIASADPSGGTPGKVNAAFSLEPDMTPPEFIRSEIVDSASLLLQFSEELDPSSIDVADFTIDDLTVNQVGVNSNYDEVRLTFSALIPVDGVFQLSVKDLQDCSRNRIEPLTTFFGFGEKAEFGDLVITEIMSDPDPQEELPDTEYLEIYNRSEKVIGLDDVFIADASDSSTTIGGLILPGEYLLLVPSSSSETFGQQNVTAIGRWTSLSNSGELLSLLSSEKRIFQINYSLAWHEEAKQDGGFSLEMRDFDNPCGQEVNWGSTIDERGGTPGEANSIAQNVPDSFGPNILNAVAESENSITVFFDEIISPASNIALELDGGISISDIKIKEDLKSISLRPEPPLTQGQEYHISVLQLQDCLGNQIRENQTTVVFPFRANENEIFLSEVLFDPRPDGSDFIEVYNTSDNFLSLQGWVVKNADNQETVASPLIIRPRSYKVLTEDKASLTRLYPGSVAENIEQVSALPGLSNTEGSIALYDENLLLDSMHYEASFHNTLLEDVEGVSLERLSFADPNDADNWTSAASIVGFATPGYANSQGLLLSKHLSNPLQIEPKVFVPGLGGNSFTTINYNVETAGFFANIYMYDQNGRRVRTLAEGISLATNGFVRWDGITDLGGTARMGYYLIIFEIYDGKGKTEVFKETVVVGRDF